MRKYSRKLLDKFKEAYRQKSNKAIGDDEANQKLSSLADLVRTIAPDSPSELATGDDSEESRCQA